MANPQLQHVLPAQRRFSLDQLRCQTPPGNGERRRDPRFAAGRRAGRDRLLRRARHVLRARVDARAGRDPVRLHCRPRPVRRARHRGRPRACPPLRCRGRRPRRLPGDARPRRPRRAPVRRLPHPDRRPSLLQHDAARPRRHRNAPREGDAPIGRRDLGRRLDLQGQRHPALLPLRPAREPEPARLQALARRRVRRGARRPQGDERVPRRQGAPPRQLRREGLLDRREPPRCDPRGEGSGAALDEHAHRRADHGRPPLGPGGRDRARRPSRSASGTASPSRSASSRATTRSPS